MPKTLTVYLKIADVKKHIDDNEFVGGVPVPPVVGVVKKHKPYDCETTLCVGKAASKYSLVNFPIHWDYLKYVFETCTYDTFGLTDANCEAYGYKNSRAGATPRETRSSKSKALITRRSSGSQAKQGNRVFFKIPTAALGSVTTGKTLVAAPSPTGGTKTRSGGSLVFPNLATIPQIGLWFATHTPTARIGALGQILNYRGSLVLPAVPADNAAFDLEVGAFSVTVRGKLRDDLAVKSAA